MKKKLTLQDFADYIAQSEGVDKTTAETFVRAFFDIIALSTTSLLKSRDLAPSS